jgi:hypothetical protein
MPAETQVPSLFMSLQAMLAVAPPSKEVAFDTPSSDMRKLGGQHALPREAERSDAP